MNISEQKLNELIEGIAANYKMKGSISTNALCDQLEKYDLSPTQIEVVYKYPRKDRHEPRPDRLYL